MQPFTLWSNFFLLSIFNYFFQKSLLWLLSHCFNCAVSWFWSFLVWFFISKHEKQENIQDFFLNFEWQQKCTVLFIHLGNEFVSSLWVKVNCLKVLTCGKMLQWFELNYLHNQCLCRTIYIISAFVPHYHLNSFYNVDMRQWTIFGNIRFWIHDKLQIQLAEFQPFQNSPRDLKKFRNKIICSKFRGRLLSSLVLM